MLGTAVSGPSMTIQEFISIWQAQPFRAFRLHARNGVINVPYSMAVALTPQMQVAAITDDGRVEFVALEEIEKCEIYGAPAGIADILASIPPLELARNAQLLSEAVSSSTPLAEMRSPAATVPLHIALQETRTPEGVLVVQAALQVANGDAVLSTSGTRWNVHGIEQFENGVSLYLHHLDHPTAEQRIMLWPPDRGTFDSFAESMPAAALAGELHRRDVKLSAKPEEPAKPSAEYFRKIDVKWPIAEKDGWKEAFGEDSPAMDPLRFEFASVARQVHDGRVIQNPCLTDIMKEEILFNLVDTDWDASARQEGRNWRLSLRHVSYPGQTLTLYIDVERLAAMVGMDSTLFSLGWIERHMRNFALYESWDRMHDALRRGPVKRRHPEVLIPLTAGFQAELWSGEPQYPLPFLHPHILDLNGQTVFDLRDTFWSAAIHGNGNTPKVTLTLSSGERSGRDATNVYPLALALVSHRVTSPNLDGSTTIGLLQGLVRRVRGGRWMLEELPQWFAKGSSLERR
jgi:hypothetical protein